MTWVIAGLLVLAVVQTMALVHLMRRLKAIDDLEARVSRFASAMTLLTDTTEAGLSTVAGALEQIDRHRATRPAPRTAVTKRVVSAARSGREVPRIARDEALSESEVRLHLALAGQR
ncbi:MAG: hypothetical protein B7X11_06005 [Acidobacteria bacterium 37-65-4]|nr:MAG: hypothetical protein B7X11_06005 [Acidobacteria bacterium 37-65-4]